MANIDFPNIIVNAQNEKYFNYRSSKNINFKVLDSIESFWKSYKKYWFSHKELNLGLFNYKKISLTYENVTNFSNLFALLIQYDQIYRHPNNEFSKNRKIALAFGKYLGLILIHNKDFSKQELWKKIFVWLAVRHGSNLKMKELTLLKVLEFKNNNKKLSEEDNALFLRFYAKSLEDYYFMFIDNELSSSISVKDTMHKWKGIIDVKANVNTSALLMYNVLPSVKKILDVINSSIIVKGVFDKVIKFYKSIKLSKNISISISGGLDSIILSFITKIYLSEYEKDLEMNLVHICYGNRDCVDDEISFLEWWSNLLCVPIYILKIKHIKRENSSNYRQMYEEITRKIRFKTYRRVCEMNNSVICLGHNNDDTFENILTNIDKRVNFDNLLGMKEVSMDSGVKILRPLLSCNKCDLEVFANLFGIPYLEDSTPKWAKRGKIRDIVKPNILNVLPSFENGIRDYIASSSYYYNFWKTSFESWCNKCSIYFKLDITKNCKNIKYNYDKVVFIKNIMEDEFFVLNYRNINFWVQMWFMFKLEVRPSNKTLKVVIDTINKLDYYSKWNSNIRTINLNRNSCLEISRVYNIEDEKYEYNIIFGLLSSIK